MSRIETLQTYLQENPKDSFLKHALALEWIKIGKDGEARLLFEELLQADPSYVGSYYHLGKLLERQDLFDEAIAVYKKGMEEAEKIKDRHSYNELQAACEDIDDSTF